MVPAPHPTLTDGEFRVVGESYSRRFILIAEFLMSEDVLIAESVLRKIITCFKNNDFDGYLEVGTDFFRSSFTQQDFDTLVHNFGEHLHHDYFLTYISDIKREAAKGYVWKMGFEKVSGECLVYLILDEHKKVALFLAL
jgi:hypothetical protein